MTRRVIESKQYPTEDMAAASFAAYRVNGALHKYNTVYDPETNEMIRVNTNRELIYSHFTGMRVLTITDQDRLGAAEAKDFLINHRALSVLQDQRVGEFVNKLVERLNQSTVTLRDCGIMEYLPDIYSKTLVKSDRASKLQMMAYTSQHFGSVGQVLNFALTVMDVKYVQKFSCYHVFGHDAEGNCIGYFTGKESCTVNGSYVGKVKAHIVDNYRNDVKVTQFNYVKLG
jgi:hypothetical protein